uniref:Cysteine protease n=1 Tax=Oryzias sinensis TaxID=183150 RepID=A0A8C7ZIE1_9TELE
MTHFVLESLKIFLTPRSPCGSWGKNTVRLQVKLRVPLIQSDAAAFSLMLISAPNAEREQLLSDVASRLWFTYRKNFPPIGGTGPTSDTGWGCMLRCGQMILAEALMCRHLGRDWRWARGRRQREEYVSILNAFIDKKDSYYSIHQIAQMGVGEGKPIGQWYGPNTVAQVLKKLAVFDTWSRLAVHVAMDNTVIIEEIKRLCMPWLDIGDREELNGCLEGACALVEEETALWKPLVLLIPLRLGLSDINEAYIDTLKQCFMLPQSLGVIGGKPNSAHYFIGYVGEELIYLDPHTTQPAVEPSEDGQVPDETYHCQHPPCRMHICELDPSIALSCKRGGLPMFELVDSQPTHMVSVDALNLTPGKQTSVIRVKITVSGKTTSHFFELHRFLRLGQVGAFFRL